MEANIHTNLKENNTENKNNKKTFNNKIKA